MNPVYFSRSELVRLLAAACVVASGFLAAQAQTYGPAAWVNDPFSTNINWTLINPNTTFPSYTNSGAVFNGNLFGNCPIGATITLTNPGDAAIFSGQVTLTGNVNASGNVQFRLGLYFKGANATDTGWAGYMIGNSTANGNGGLYLRNIPNTGIYGSGTGTTQPALTGSLFTAGWGAATYDFFISVTKLSATSSLVRWKLQGVSPSVYLFSGRYTNNSATTQGGFSFDQVGLLSGGSTWSSAGGLIEFTNVMVTVGQFRDGGWTNDASGLWSATNNWSNGITANGSGFIADFSQVNLTADRTVTLDTPRTIGRMIFGATSGSTNNWSLDSSGGSLLSLDSGVAGGSGVPVVAVNQNTATLSLSMASSNGLTKAGPGTLVLQGSNAILGPLNLNAGTLSFLSLANLPLSLDSITAVNFRGGVLQWASGNTFDLTSSGIPINFIGNAAFDTGPNNVTFGTSFGDGGAGGLMKLGSGRLTLNGSASYTGTTTINNGVLALGAAGSIPSSANVTILPGATFDVTAPGGFTLASSGTLAGSGTVLGNVADSPSAVLSPGTNGPGTLTVNGNLTLNGSGVLNYDLSNVTTPGGGVNDLIAVTGNLNIAGPTALNINFLNGAPGLGIYTLFSYNTFSGSEANLTAPLGFSVTNDTAAKVIGLVVTHVPADLTWRGDGTANLWDTATTANWIQSGTNQVFFTSDSVTFDDTGSNSPPINISGTVSPAAVTVNATNDYDFTGGAIASGRLTKNNTGTLILENNNTYAGPTVIGGGTLQVGNGTGTGALGTGPVTNNSALVFNVGADYTLASTIRGTGSITNIGAATVTLSGNISGSTMNMAGPGTMVLSGSNSYTGQTIVFSGSLRPRNSAALGTAAAGTVVSNGAQLYIDANVDILGESLSLAGTGLAVDGALRKGGAGTTTWGGAITMTADTRIQLDGNATLNLTNTAAINAPGINVTLGADGGAQGNIVAALNLGAGALTKEGGGTWTIARTNNYTGKTVINGGFLAIPGTNSLGPVSAFTPDYVTLNGGALGVTTNVTFNDGLRGFTASGTAGGFDVGAGLTLVIANEITGAGTITKSGAGTLVLRGSNPFTGTLNVDTGVPAGTDGILLIANPNAIANVVSPIAIRDNLGASSTLQLDGSSGNIVATQTVTLNGRSPTIPAIQNVAGTNTLAGGLTLNSGGARYFIQSDSGLLTLGGFVSSTTLDPQTITFLGNGDLSVTGVIQDGTNVVGVDKEGSGRLTLNGVNTYTGATTVNGGVLGGTGTISGPVSVSSGGTLSPGSSIGTLTISNSLTLAGNTFVEVNKTTGASDQVVGLTSVAYGGTLTVSNVSGALLPGDSFQIFPATAFSGNFTSITGAGMSWRFNPTNGVLTAVIPITPTNINFSVSGGNLTLSWPSGYTGWILQTQTNALSVGLTTNWVDVAGSDTTNSITVPILPTNPTVFFRLRHPLN